ncbi:uncharacterized protein LOC111257758 [Setaria italica]|nr:uncharacterized protein LOC111257758 [Setaria italica]
MSTTKSRSMLVVVAMAVVLLLGTTAVSLATAASGATLDAKSPHKLACHGEGCHSQTTMHLSKQDLGKTANLDASKAMVTTDHLPPFVSARICCTISKGQMSCTGC